VGQAFNFDGVNDFVDMGDVLDLGATSFSIDFWYKASGSSAGGGNFRLVSKGLFSSGVPADSGYGFQLLNGQLNFTVSDPNEVTLVTVQVPESSPGDFHHLAGVLDRGASTAELYVDGAFVGQGSFTGLGNLDTDLPLTLGHGVGGSNDFSQGLIDEVDLFNRALTATDIQDIFDADSAGKIQPPG